MKIRSILIRGFRGFNEEREIRFNDKLTLIYAPNSYGKTSISEAFEWLIYGSTSKVERAKTKLEFRGAYRNVHYANEEPPAVTMRADQAGKSLTLSAHLHGVDEQRRYIGEELKELSTGKWPFQDELDKAPKPFILQHALKDLLLASPDERFQGFAQLLGFDDLDRIHKDVIALCTAPVLPQEVEDIQRLGADLELSLSKIDSLEMVSRAFKAREPGLEDLYQVVQEESLTRVPEGTEVDSILPQLLLARQQKIAKIVDVEISTPDFSEEEKKKLDSDSGFFVSYLADDFIEGYSKLIALSALSDVVEHVAFLRYGLAKYEDSPGTCPFCGKELSEEEIQHIEEVHGSAKEKAGDAAELGTKRRTMRGKIEQLNNKVNEFHDNHTKRLEGLLTAASQMDKLSEVLDEKHSLHLKNIQAAMEELDELVGKFDASRDRLMASAESVAKSLKRGEEDSQLMKSLSSEIPEYISIATSLREAIGEHANPVNEADQILQKELDELAKTQDVSLLIRLIESRQKLEKNLKIADVLNGLKELRSSIDEFVANRMLDAVAERMTRDVMRWYEKIKTTGDPDIHFEGFDLERTKKGKVKARRVEVKAQSYGKELVSAVSSLSESKLNALGLSMSLAVNLSEDSPFGFILIDDPIQSLDEEHSAQFAQVIRELAEEGLQIVILSHNKTWLDQVKAGSRSLNGLYYEITGYTEEGPFMSTIPWATSKQRLDTVDAILKNNEASTVHLQQAEEELRLVFSELTAAIYQKTKEKHIHPSSLNAEKIRKKLIECGVEDSMVDKVVQAFETIDPAHHSDPDYTPNRDRIRTYHSWAHQLAQRC